MSHQLFTSFKGLRHYIQGGDLFNAVQEVSEIAVGSKDAFIGHLYFKRFAYHLCYLVISSNEKDLTNHLIGGGDFVLPDGSRQSFWLLEGKQVPLERIPYDEDLMMVYATYGEKSAMLKAPIQYSSIEVIIALTKALNYKLSTPKSGKWVFGKIELNQALPTIYSSVMIRQEKAVLGRFSVNEIIIDGNKIGAIQFIVGTP